jgi:prepilin-type N-terminal cleavage/methylation domain-containing protein/prepilin-type processing-associated H-X9-DG protein
MWGRWKEPSAMRPAPRWSRRVGFTLVELLVVVGIVGLLIAILLPVVGKAREAANRAKCLSNVRQLAAAVIGYMAENRHTLPEAIPSNDHYAGYGPQARGLPAWTPLPPGTPQPEAAYVIPTIGDLLSKWVGDEPLWQCPSAGQRFPYVAEGDFLRGHTYADEWSPNYFYLGTKDYVPILMTSPDVGDGFSARSWLARNVAGLRLGQLRTLTRQSASDIVTFLDTKSLYHTRATKDLYKLAPGEFDDYYANFGFLDGHAEGRGYKDNPGYFEALHRPIPQTWFGVDFAALAPASYQPPYP